MGKLTRYVGLDVHAATIAVAVAEGRNVVRSLGTIPNRPEAVAKLVKKLGSPGSLHVLLRGGSAGYVLYWQLTKLGVQCEVVAPSLVPVKSGDRVKTDRRDAEKLARALRAGDLTSVFVPSLEHEALRDLVRAREAAKKDELRARHRLRVPAALRQNAPDRLSSVDPYVLALGAHRALRPCAADSHLSGLHRRGRAPDHPHRTLGQGDR